MGFIVKPRCLGCAHSWGKMQIGNAKNVLCICRNCRNIVNPARVEFRYEIENCGRCRQPLVRSDLIDALALPVDYNGTTASNVQCPRCETGLIAFAAIAHFSIGLEERCPAVGQLVQGAFDEQGVLRIPGMFLLHTETKITGLPVNPEPHRRLELKTARVVQPGEKIEMVEFEFLGFVDG